MQGQAVDTVPPVQPIPGSQQSLLLASVQPGWWDNLCGSHPASLRRMARTDIPLATCMRRTLQNVSARSCTLGRMHSVCTMTLALRADLERWEVNGNRKPHPTAMGFTLAPAKI